MTETKTKPQELELLDVTADQLYVQDGAKAIVERIRKDALSIVPDITTAKGRESIASVAYKVARAKTHLDGLGKEFVSELKAKAAAVDEKRRYIRTELDAIKDAVRKPLDEWEAAKAKREAEIKERIEGIRNTVYALMADESLSSERIREAITKLEQTAVTEEDYGDKADEAKLITQSTVLQLEGLYAKRKLAEDNAAKAEAERKAAEEAAAKAKAEAEAKERAEREERIRKEAEAKAKAEAEAAAKRAAEEAEAKRQAEIRARQEAERKAAEEVARALAEKERIQAEAEARIKAERERMEREQQAKQEAEAKAKAEAEAIEAKRIANAKHRATVEREAAESLDALNLASATDIIAAIKSGKVSHVTINY